MQELFFVMRNDFRRWLTHHHDKEGGIKLIDDAKKSGMWNKEYPTNSPGEIPNKWSFTSC